MFFSDGSGADDDPLLPNVGARRRLRLGAVAARSGTQLALVASALHRFRQSRAHVCSDRNSEYSYYQ